MGVSIRVAHWAKISPAVLLKNPRMWAAAASFHLCLLLLLSTFASGCPADSFECPSKDTFCVGGAGDGPLVGSWQECGVLCAAEPTCFFWSFVCADGLCADLSSGVCLLCPVCDYCLDGQGYAISGKKGCVE